jgi:hypothetical protein
VGQVVSVLGHSLDGCLDDVHLVRDVAPTKQMVCVSFKLPWALLGLRKRSRDSP